MSDTTDTNEDVSGLKNKITELLATIKTEKARADKAERDAQDAADTAVSANSSELEKAVKRAEKAERDAKSASERADDIAKTLRKVRADNAITQAISEYNVDAKHVRAATAILKMDMEFSDDGEPLINGKSVGDYAKSYFAKDGQTYVRAANNTGGLATGNDGSTGTKWSKLPVTSAEWAAFDSMPPVERNAVCEQLNAPQLKV